MKKIRKGGQVDIILFATILILLAIGVVMIYSASSYSALYIEKDSMYYLKRQLMWSILGIGAMIFTIMIDHHKIRRLTGVLMLISIPLLFMPFLWDDINGAYRWIQLGFISFQPSELVKYVVVLYLANSIANKGERIKSFVYGILPALFVAGIYAGIILIQKNLSIAAVIMMTTIVMLFVGGAKNSQMFTLLPAVGAAGVYFALSTDYRRARVLSFLDPFKDAAGSGYQVIQSWYALGSGGLLGLGLGNSRQKAFYMPEPHTDFIFSIIGEELGLIGCLFIILLFIIFAWRGVTIAYKAKDAYSTLLAVGITSIIIIQAAINIAVVTGSMPVTGVPLPFISYGGSSLLLNMLAMGILLNISKQNDKTALG